MPAERYDVLTRLSARLEPLLAGVPDLVIANSEAGRRAAIARGFVASRCVVVPNGIELEAFRPLPAAARIAARARLGLPPDRRLVGVVGRLDPMKDHDGFLRAFALAARRQDLHAVIAGPGAPRDAARLRGLAEGLGIAARLVIAGPVVPVAELIAALDLLCLPSAYGEGFPNVLGEAMACGVPCVASDVGDCAEILGGLGWVAPPGDPVALAEAIIAALDAAAAASSLAADLRARAAERYGVERMVDATATLLRELCVARRR
jgi:glycosyltransferase involved in cell wall biosynthesis